MPETEDDMLKIDGVTKSNFEKFGQPLLEIIQQAAAEKSGIRSHYLYSHKRFMKKCNILKNKIYG